MINIQYHRAIIIFASKRREFCLLQWISNLNFDTPLKELHFVVLDHYYILLHADTEPNTAVIRTFRPMCRENANNSGYV